MINAFRVMLLLIVSSVLTTYAMEKQIVVFDKFNAFEHALQNEIVLCSSNNKNEMRQVCMDWSKRFSIRYPAVCKLVNLRFFNASPYDKMRIELTQFLIQKYEVDESGKRRSIDDIAKLFAPIFPLNGHRTWSGLSTIQMDCFAGDVKKVFNATVYTLRDPNDLRVPAVLIGALAICIECDKVDCLKCLLTNCAYWFEKKRLLEEAAAAFLLNGMKKSAELKTCLCNLVREEVVKKNSVFYL